MQKRLASLGPKSFLLYGVHAVQHGDCLSDAPGLRPYFILTKKIQTWKCNEHAYALWSISGQPSFTFPDYQHKLEWYTQAQAALLLTGCFQLFLFTRHTSTPPIGHTWTTFIIARYTPWHKPTFFRVWGNCEPEVQLELWYILSI